MTEQDKKFVIQALEYALHKCINVNGHAESHFNTLANAIEVVKKCSMPDVSHRLMVGSKVFFISHKNKTGVIVDRSDIGFNHWMVKWDRTDQIVREYGADLVVC
jgi:hypothetical protein